MYRTAAIQIFTYLLHIMPCYIQRFRNNTTRSTTVWLAEIAWSPVSITAARCVAWRQI